MFIKIRTLEVRKDENQVVITSTIKSEDIYDCDHITLFSSEYRSNNSKGHRENETIEMNLVIEFNADGPNGFDRTIYFPAESDTICTEIYIMNNQGKTIDRIIY